MPWSCNCSLCFPCQNPVCISLLPHTCHMHCSSLLPCLITLTIPGKQYQSYSPSFCSFLQATVTSSPLPPNITLSTLLSNTLSLCSFLNVQDQVSHPHKTAGKIMVLQISLLCCLAWVQCNNHQSAELLNIDMPPGKLGCTHFLRLMFRLATMTMRNTTIKREMHPVTNENISKSPQSCNTHTLPNDHQVFEMQMQAKKKNSLGLDLILQWIKLYTS